MFKILVLAALLVAANGALLGSKKCTWGPSYWCATFDNANECGAMEHCKMVWSTMNKLVGAEGVSQTKTDDTDACTFCKDMVSDVKNFIESNQTRETILQYWNRACDFMPDKFSKQECLKVEVHYLDVFIQCVKDNVDPGKLCKMALLCTKQKVSKADTVGPAASLTPAKLSRVTLTKSSEVKSGDALCDGCKAFMDLVANEVKDPKNQEKVKDLLLNECKQLGQLAQECQTLVNSTFPEIVVLLEQELNENLCKLAQLCDSTSYSAVVFEAKKVFHKWFISSNLKTALQATAGRLNDQECDTCEMIVGYAKMFLENNNTEASLAQILKTDVCSKLGEFSQLCNTLVDQYLPQAYQKLLEFVDPKSLCTELGLCSNSSVSVAKPKPTKVEKQRAKASPTCVLCEFVMSKLDDMLSDNATEEEIVAAVEKICTVLPQSVKGECDNFIDKYGQVIIHLLAEAASPSVVCGFIGLCSSGDSMYKKELNFGDNCMMCELAMGYVKSMLKKNSTEQEILETVEKVCNYLSGDVAQQCNSMIEKYGPQIVQMIVGKVEQMDSKTICTDLGMCASAKAIKPDGLVHLFNRAANV